MIEEFPQGWAGVTLSKLSQPSRPRRNPRKYARLPFVGLEQVESQTRRLLGTLPSSQMKSTAFHFQAGDVLYGRLRPYLNKVLCAEFEGLCSSEFIVIPPNDSFDPKYLAFYLSTDQFVTFANQLNQGDRPRVNFDQIGEREIPLPPITEQHRIVSKIVKLMGHVDACQQRLAKIPTLLKRFRQSVLAAACSGRLTADWREEHSSLESVEALFTKIKNERQRRYENDSRRAKAAGRRKPKHPDSNEQSRNIVSDLPDIPDTWEYFRMEELCHQVTDGTHKTPKYQTSGVPFLSVKNVRPFLVRDTDIKFISEEEHRSMNSRCNPEKGDILYTKIGATFGYAAVNELDHPFSIFVSLALLKPATPFFSSAFAELVMNSEVVFNQARERVSGIGTPDLHLVEIRDFRVPLPPQAEQQEIVRRVESLFALADRIEAHFASGRKRVDALTQAILAKAFRGELVPTEFELAKAEGRSFESAEELLARIRSASGPNGNGSKPRKQKSK